jgi:hypothetical protein
MMLLASACRGLRVSMKILHAYSLRVRLNLMPRNTRLSSRLRLHPEGFFHASREYLARRLKDKTFF